MKRPVATVFSPRTPSFRAVPFLRSAAPSDAVELTVRQREELAQIAMRVRLPPRMVIYREDAAADWVFAVEEGAVKCYRELPSGKRAVGAFLFAHDLFGLAENGRYLNSAQSITPVTLYRLPVKELILLVKRDADLQFQFLSKVTHELRESQRRALLVNRRDAVGRFAMFITLMGERQDWTAKNGCTVPLPMTRSDIASFLGLSLESVCRAAVELERRGLVEFENLHLVRIRDVVRLAKLVTAV